MHNVSSEHFHCVTSLTGMLWFYIRMNNGGQFKKREGKAQLNQENALSMFGKSSKA